MANSIKCAKCGDIITSHHRRDYVQCGCGAVAVDGGDVYHRYVGDLESILVLRDGVWSRLMEDQDNG